MHALAASALIALAGPERMVGFPIRIIRTTPAGPRYLRLRSQVAFSGVRGDGLTVLDLRTGRYAERVSAGPLSYSDGFDGRRSWQADATGMAVVEGNAENVRDQLAWAGFYGRPGSDPVAVRRVRETPGAIVVQLRYQGLTAPLEVTLDPRTGYVRRVDDATGGERATSTFGAYRSVAGATVPYALTSTTRYGVVHETIAAVETPPELEASEFAAPARPDDTLLDGVTTVPMQLSRGSAIVPARIDDGPVLHVLLDSGSSNFLTVAAAKRLGLQLVGADKSGGVGAGLVPQRYTTAHRVQVGDAVLRDQPFAVLAYGERGIDGALGCELFERLAVRFDFAKRVVRLARDASDLGTLGTPVPMRLNGCSPEVDGEVDAVHGALLLDTGSAASVDIFTPAVKRYGLVARYRFALPVGGGGIGGTTHGLMAFARTVRLGSETLHAIPIILDAMQAGALTSTSNLGNVGTEVLRRFVPTFDYRGGTLWLQPVR